MYPSAPSKMKCALEAPEVKSCTQREKQFIQGPQLTTFVPVGIKAQPFHDLVLAYSHLLCTQFASIAPIYPLLRPVSGIFRRKRKSFHPFLLPYYTCASPNLAGLAKGLALLPRQGEHLSLVVPFLFVPLPDVLSLPHLDQSGRGIFVNREAAETSAQAQRMARSRSSHRRKHRDVPSDPTDEWKYS